MTANHHNTVVLSLGNDPQVEYALNMFRSLRDAGMGEFRGDLLFTSDELSSENQTRLRRCGVSVKVISGASIDDAKTKLKSQTHPFGKVGKFFLIRESLKNLLNLYQYFVFMDPDVLCQAPFAVILDEISDHEYCMAPEPVDIAQNPILYDWLKVGCRDESEWDIMRRNYRFEVNTGVMAASIPLGLEFIDRFVQWQLSDDYAWLAEKSSSHRGWHDQDFFRFFHLKYQLSNLKLLTPEKVFHMVGWANFDYEWDSVDHKIRVTQERLIPNLVHFAGCSHIIKGQK